MPVRVLSTPQKFLLILASDWGLHCSAYSTLGVSCWPDLGSLTLDVSQWSLTQSLWDFNAGSPEMKPTHSCSESPAQLAPP